MRLRWLRAALLGARVLSSSALLCAASSVCRAFTCSSAAFFLFFHVCGHGSRSAIHLSSVSFIFSFSAAGYRSYRQGQQKDNSFGFLSIGPTTSPSVIFLRLYTSFVDGKSSFRTNSLNTVHVDSPLIHSSLSNLIQSGKVPCRRSHDLFRSQKDWVGILFAPTWSAVWCGPL